MYLTYLTIRNKTVIATNELYSVSLKRSQIYRNLVIFDRVNELNHCRLYLLQGVKTMF